MISLVPKSSLDSESLEEVSVIPEKSEPLVMVDNEAVPLVFTVTVCVVRGLGIASTVSPVAPLMVATSTSVELSELCK